MLEKVLRTIAARESSCSSELARRLAVSEALIESMLETLAQLGYLKPLVSQAPCRRCPMRSACLYRKQGRIWALSERGERVLLR